MQKVLRPISTQWVKVAQLWTLPFITSGRHRARQIWTLCKLFIFNRTLTTPAIRCAALPQSWPHTLRTEDGFLCVLLVVECCSLILSHCDSSLLDVTGKYSLSSLVLFYITIILYFPAHGHTCHSVQMEVRGHFVGVVFFYSVGTRKNRLGLAASFLTY